MKYKVGSCFSGIGGIELGLEWTGGFQTEWQIESDDYATKILEKHWPHVKRYRDIRDVVRPEPVDLICGGFPCQDVSLAGQRSGLNGTRSTLWGEMFRLVCEVKPRWVVAENVPGLLSSDGGRFFGNILRDLASAGYDAEWGVLSAAGVGAPHLRKRVFILADTSRNEQRRTWQTSGRQSQSSDICNAPVEGFQNGTEKTVGGQKEEPESERSDWWATEPDVGRVAHGVPSRVDRLRCLGNAVLPQVAQKVGEMILRLKG